jgi:DNA-binding transcriptional regulator GbsR (MarR family)
MALTPVQQKFVLHWGEMGDWWGINRSVAQVHALLYIRAQPMNAEQIADALGIARSNVSTSLKELQTWGIVRVAPVRGDRKEYFESLGDVWEMFRKVMEERRRRELEPTVRLLKECAAEAAAGGKSETGTKERIDALLEFLHVADTWYESVRRLPPAVFVKFMKMGGKLSSFLPVRTGVS